jgi:hypothetical protein
VVAAGAISRTERPLARTITKPRKAENTKLPVRDLLLSRFRDRPEPAIFQDEGFWDWLTQAREKFSE